MSKQPNFWRTACCVLLALVCGYALARFGQRDRSPLSLPEVPLHAYATDNNENLIIATGQVGDEVEGVFFLDTLSGDLQCTVYSPSAGAFNSLFTANVLQDLGLEATKKPAYLMVTGQINAVRRSAKNVGNCIVYVAEANSGRFAAYAVPWRRNQSGSGIPQAGKMILLGVESVRTAAVRE
ncbi:MAG: hypothetical protein AAGF97_10940 [Planctomycetota bacterium]